MSKGDVSENDYLKLVYNAIPVAGIADNAASGALTSIPVALHTAAPGDAGDQTSNEIAYSNYIRALVARTSGGWSIVGNSCVNAGAVSWPQCGATGGTAMFWSTGAAASGPSKIFHWGPIGSALGPFVGENSNDQITNKGHGLSVDDRVCFFAAPYSTLPTGVTSGTVYYVKTVPDSDTITLSLTSGGATVDITADGDGDMFKVTPIVISNLGTPSIAAGGIAISED